MRERDKKALSLKCHDTVLVYRKYRNILLGDKRSNSVIPSSLNCTLFNDHFISIGYQLCNSMSMYDPIWKGPSSLYTFEFETVPEKIH